MSQEEIFLLGEGDRWFQRVVNCQPHSPKLLERERLLISSIPRKLQSPAGTFVEVGCSRGDSLRRISNETGMTAVGIEPSESAIAAGKSLFTGLDLRKGTASQTGLPTHFADVLYFGWCLTYVESTAMPCVMAEVKRVLKHDGILAVYDFDFFGSRDFEWDYKHLSGVKTYRRNYLQLFAREGFGIIGKFPLWEGGEHLGFHENAAERLTLLVMSMSTNFRSPERLD